MELFVKAETLGGDEMPTCEECKERRKCVKWYVAYMLNSNFKRKVLNLQTPRALKTSKKAYQIKE